MNRRRLGIAAWLIAAALLSLAAVALGRDAGRGGLVMTARVLLPDGTARDVVRQVRAVDARDLHADPGLARGPVSVRWSGAWHVPQGGTYRLLAEANGAVTIAVDGAPALSASGGRARASVDLPPGAHALAVSYEGSAVPRRLRLQWAGPSGARGEFGPPWVLSPGSSPKEAARARRSPVVLLAALLAWAVPPLAVLLVAWRRGRLGARTVAALRIALPALVVLYAAALRFEAVAARYLWAGPAWVISAERALSELHGPSLRWTAAPDEEFGGDPLTYLRRARAMSGLYEADVREPLFPFAARLFLPLADGRTWPVNAASAVFSTLLVLATYLLGATAFSRAVGLAAALVLALDRDAIWWGAEGFRDDAFALFTVLAAAALVRLRTRPPAVRAALAGLAGGAACLTRLSGFSFLLPAHLWLALGRGDGARARRRAAAMSLLVALAVAAPYVAACAIAYGDPLYAVNVHTKFYRSRSGMDYQAAMSWSGYLRSAFGGGELLRTGLVGLTAYPFRNKWTGLDWVTPWLRRGLAPLAVAGLVMLAASPQGRLLLVVLFGALLPYAFTWTVPGGAEWRFTLVAYPFYLVAAVLAAERGGAFVARRLRREGGPP